MEKKLKKNKQPAVEKDETDRSPIKTDEPLSEKDEVKQAEENQRKRMNKNK